MMASLLGGKLNITAHRRIYALRLGVDPFLPECDEFESRR
jgi:hypothetical protein